MAEEQKQSSSGHIVTKVSDIGVKEKTISSYLISRPMGIYVAQVEINNNTGAATLKIIKGKQES